MSIETLANTMAFLGLDNDYFEITAGNDVLVLTSDQGGPCNIDVADGHMMAILLLQLLPQQ